MSAATRQDLRGVSARSLVMRETRLTRKIFPQRYACLHPTPLLLKMTRIQKILERVDPQYRSTRFTVRLNKRSEAKLQQFI